MHSRRDAVNTATTTVTTCTAAAAARTTSKAGTEECKECSFHGQQHKRNNCGKTIMLIHTNLRTMHLVTQVSDDMRPELGTYGAAHIHSPHLDALAADGMVFERAYVMVSLCMPSRTAFLTSRRPDTTKNYVIGAEYWRTTNGPNATSLPQHFKESGYRTIGMGKMCAIAQQLLLLETSCFAVTWLVSRSDRVLPCFISSFLSYGHIRFHGAAFPWTPGKGQQFSAGAWDGNFSWSQEAMPYYNFDNWSHYGDSISFGAFDVPDNNMQDGRFADRAVRKRVGPQRPLRNTLVYDSFLCVAPLLAGEL
eukprot:SAG31_NODE_7965_length_1554_cov_1.247423_1_plen_306_part_01